MEPSLLEQDFEYVLIFAMFVMTCAIAISMVRMYSLFAMAMMTGIFSLFCAGLFIIMDAVDVAFTEAAVGAGMSTVLFLGTLALTGSIEKRVKGVDKPALLLVAVVGGMLLYGTSDLPDFGDPDAPIHHHVGNRYVQVSEAEVGPPNIVTSVLAAYRSYDTMGEVAVIFTAGLGVVILLGGSQRFARTRYKPDEEGDENPTALQAADIDGAAGEAEGVQTAQATPEGGPTPGKETT
ncbi:MAG: DUF4040 domain-containing protein [Rhodospirillaceae bacterium]